ncbi:hypothetical protein LTR37_004710 [Vermiconidia calcicola]|uniref:Uncharacterized protein n=1 Tax=Vermiconidia calcicola TaxID=1690605 RepID=A0ACC3NMA9_9PEZI|nr:hypothetical protein LTR37_004710 [Vermiconidia calcicola]
MSDVHYMLKDLPMRYFMDECGVRSPGHEGAGVVVKVGDSVKDWKVGDRAGIKPMMDVCHNCEQCWNGIEQWCRSAVNTGLQVPGTYQVSTVNISLLLLCTLAEYQMVYRMRSLGPSCAASTMHRALIESGLKPGQWVVFPGGGGGVGAQGVQLAKAMGMRAIVVDTGEQKAALAERIGADAFIDFRKENDVLAKVREIADGLGAHGVLVTAWQTYKDAVSYMSYIGGRIGGKITCIGLPPKDANVELGASPLIFAGLKLTITGSIVGTMQDTAAALEYARRGLLQPISEVRGLSRFAESVQQLKRGEVPGRIVIDFNKQ